MLLNLITIITSTLLKIKSSKKHIIKFILNEIMLHIQKAIENFSKLDTYPPKIKIDKPEDLDKLINEGIKKKFNSEVNKRIFHIKEELSEIDFFSYSFFRNEWDRLYFREITSYSLWLLYSSRPAHILGNNFYFRQKKLFKIFNISNPNIGGYEPERKKNTTNLYFGLISIWSAIKIWLFSALILFSSIYILMLKRSSVLPQTLFFWLALSMLLYWLVSGFVFFVKKYQYSRFTSVIQRFWRRTYILFWLVESGLLLVFFYLTVNSTQESFYMFDQGYFLKTHLFSWKLFLFKCILVVSLITYSYLLLVNLKWSTFNRTIINLVIITLLLLYFVWIEFYQIYWVSNFYANFSWVYDFEDLSWNLEVDGRRTRILNHYIMILFLLKFWHIIFIFGCWIFFLLRSNELDTITYPLYSFNLQNFIILFIMMWLFMYPWFKHTYHWLSEIPYYWFYIDIHVNFYKLLINDIYSFYYNCFFNIFNFNKFTTLKISNFINWFFIDGASSHDVFIKSTIKNEILQNLI